MNLAKDLAFDHLLSSVPHHLKESAGKIRARLKLKPSLDILVVVDGSVKINAIEGDFGLSRMLEALQNTEVGCARIKFKTASRDNDKAKVAAASPHEFSFSSRT